MRAQFCVTALAACLAAACHDSTAPGSPAELVFATLPASVDAGDGMTVEIAVRDAKGRAVASATTGVTIAIAHNPAGGTLSGGLTVAAVNGVARFTDVHVDKSGSGYTLTASASGLPPATSAPFTVTAGMAQKLAFITQPTDAGAGAPMLPAVRVTVLDAFDNVVTSYASSISVALGTANGATIQGPASLPPTNGVATFGGIRITKAGSAYTLVASAPGVSSTTSSAFSIAPGSATQVAFLTSPSAPVDAGRPITPAVRVGLQDAYGNVTQNGSATISIAIANNVGAAHIFGTLDATTVNGVATFANVIIDRPGSGYTLSASGLASTATSAPFDVRLLFATVSAGGLYWEEHTCAVSTAGAGYCWGGNSGGQVGSSGGLYQIARPSLVAGGLAFTAISAGGYHTCGITVASDLYCWGYNGDSQLGTGSSSSEGAPRQVAGNMKFKAVAAGEYHTCALTTSGTAYCWGNNSDGRAGVPGGGYPDTPVQVSSLVFDDISADSAHTCALSAGKAYCWGSNAFGQLGDSTTTSRSTPTPVAGDHTWSMLATGGRHTCAVEASTQLPFCWGDNSTWQTADSMPQDRTTPRMWPRQAASASPLTQVSRLSAGINFTCAVGIVNDQGSPIAWCWGGNDRGQIGNDSRADVSLPVTVFGGTPNTIAISAGYSHACEVVPGNLVACWGDNASGQLGDGTMIARTTPKLITP